MSFGVMTLTAIIDIVTGAFGKELLIQEFIYNSFVWITLGSFGIAGAEKVMGEPFATADRKTRWKKISSTKGFWENLEEVKFP